MKRVTSLLLVLLALSSTAAAAQQSPVWVKYGKWALLAGSIGMNVLAAESHHTADQAFDEIRSRCFANTDLCALAPTGVYQDPEIEALYQRTLHYDRRARNWLIGGEAALVGAGVMFIWELSRPKALPANIPFEPDVSVTPHETRLGLVVRF